MNGGGAGARGHGKNGVALQANVDSKDAVSVVLGGLRVQHLQRLLYKRNTVAMGVLLIVVVLLSLGEGGRCTAAAGSLSPRLWRAATKLLQRRLAKQAAQARRELAQLWLQHLFRHQMPLPVANVTVSEQCQ